MPVSFKPFTKTILCAREQADREHKFTADQRGELVAECTGPSCGAFLKFPAGLTDAALDALLGEHAEANDRRVIDEPLNEAGEDDQA